MKKTVLVTGAAGSVGFETVKTLAAHDQYHVIACDLDTRKNRKKLRTITPPVTIALADITDSSSMNKITRNIDAVIHLAAVIPPLADKKPELAAKVNIGGTKTLIDACRSKRKEITFLYSSSISVYGDRIDSPWIRTTDPLLPSEGDYYAETKIQAEQLVQNSGLNWTIFRFTAIMNPGMKADPLMFHMPLNTRLEVLSEKDTATAMVKALACEKVRKRIFNLGGGNSCRTDFKTYLNQVFTIIGLGKNLLPPAAFAQRNFHCGYYADSDELENILRFRSESLNDFFERIHKKTGPVNRFFNRICKPAIKNYLLRHSEPLKARSNTSSKLFSRFFFPETTSSP